MKYRLHWRSGAVEDIEGVNIHEAFTKAGYKPTDVRDIRWSQRLEEGETDVRLHSEAEIPGELDSGKDGQN